MYSTAPRTIPARASADLERFILRDAPAHYATESAPHTFATLRAAYAETTARGLPLPVYSGGCDRTIYSSPAINHAARAWHDATHVQLAAEFTPEGELRVAIHTARRVLECGLSYRDAALVFADVWGQVCYAAAHGGDFPADQAAFIGAWMADKAAAVARTF